MTDMRGRFVVCSGTMTTYPTKEDAEKAAARMNVPVAYVCEVLSTVRKLEGQVVPDGYALKWSHEDQRYYLELLPNDVELVRDLADYDVHSTGEVPQKTCAACGATRKGTVKE